MKRRSSLLLMLSLPALVQAQGDPVFNLLITWQRAAQRAWAARALAFAQRATELAATPTGPAWTQACLAWERLVAWPLSPVKERRAALRIDFNGLREPRLRQLAERWQAGADTATLGSDVMGLPALEALLFPSQPAALPLARDLARMLQTEAQALAELAESKTWVSQTEERALEWRNEAVGAWLDGIEQLRINYLDKPQRPGGKRPRSRAGIAEAALLMRWSALREAGGELLKLLAVQTNVRLASEGERRLRAAEEAIQRGQLRAASQALAALLAWAQQQASPALNVPAGFSDADGD